jgi:hypothetical protein
MITPFSGPSFIEGALLTVKLVCARYALDALRGDENPEDSPLIHARIVESIRQADLIVAEVSLPNPNVFWELGFACGVRGMQNIIQIAKEGTSLPFDIAGIDTVFYSGQSDLESKFAARVRHFDARRHRLRTIHPLNDADPPHFAICSVENEWRSKHRAIEPLEQRLPIDMLPGGVFGFTPPWALRDGALNSSRAGTAVAEVHKTTDGVVYLVCWIRRKDADLFAMQAVRDRPEATVITFEAVREFFVQVAIPLSRMASLEQRPVGDYGYVGDVEII